MSDTLPIARDTRTRLLAAAAGQVAFDFDCPVFDAADLFVGTIAAGAVWPTEVTTGVTVTVLPDHSGATATFAVAPRPTGGDPAVTIMLQGRRLHERLASVTRSGAIRSQDLEAELDRIALVLQEVRRDVDAVGPDVYDAAGAAAADADAAAASAAAGAVSAGNALTSETNAAASAASVAGALATKQPLAAVLTSLSGLGAALVSGDILYASGASALMRLPKGGDGQVLTLAAGVPSWAAPVAATPWPPGTISGLITSRSTVTTWTVGAGSCRNEDGGAAQNMTLAAPITKSLSAWAAGSGNGGLDTGAVAANLTYHMHLIRKDSDGSLDALLSLSATAPTMPGGYTARRRIGSIKTDGSSQIIPYTQDNDEFLLSTPVIDVNTTALGTTAILYALSVPTGVKVQALVTAFMNTGVTNGVGLLITSPDAADTAPGGTSGAPGGPLNAGTNSDRPAMVALRIRTNTSAQVRARASTGSGNTFQLHTFGWIDARGRG